MSQKSSIKRAFMLRLSCGLESLVGQIRLKLLLCQCQALVAHVYTTLSTHVVLVFGAIREACCSNQLPAHRLFDVVRTSLRSPR